MILRELREEDALLMLEWMHDDSITHYMETDFFAKNVSDCLDFIKYAQEQYITFKAKNIHLAIIDDSRKNPDEYLGTISLKSIDRIHEISELAIIMRRKAMGQGISKRAMAAIVKVAKKRFGLKYIYWYVKENNIRAVRFYEKIGCQRVTINRIKSLGVKITGDLEMKDYIWYIKQL